MEKSNIVVRVMSRIWSGADAVRKVLHLVLLLVVFLGFFGALSGGGPPSVPGTAALVIKPDGKFVEQLAGDPIERAFNEAMGDGEPQTLVQDVVDALAFARDDDRIHVVYFNVTTLFTSGVSKLQRVADAITDFKSSGKTVIAYGDFMSQAAYYVAAHADEIYMSPQGGIWMPGFGAFREYYKNAIDLLRVDWNVFRAGTHKSAFEPYTQMQMSEEDRQTRSRLIEQLWSQFRQDIVAARGLEDGDIQDYAANLLENMQAAGGDFATVAVDSGLVDGLRSRIEVRGRLIEIVGADPDKPDAPNVAGMHHYLAQMRMLSGSSVGDENVAVVIASGSIEDGSRPPGTIGGDSTAELLRQALNDETVKAVVLRVDSGGGSAFASEVIGGEIRALKAAGKPVVASMSSVAASGGYWISMDADRIIASPSTITGSIGVLSMFPTFQRTLAAVGVATDGVGTSPWAGAIRPDRELSEDAKALFQMSTEAFYADFVAAVATGRGMDENDVDRVGQGQVWLAGDAVEYGLVDELGELDDAIDVAAELAGLDEWGVKTIEIEPSPTEQILIDLVGASVRVGIDPSTWLRKPSAVEQVADRLLDQAQRLLRFNDPMGRYSICFCDFE